VAYRLEKAGLREIKPCKRNISDSQKEIALSLFEQGKRPLDIAKTLGLGSSSVYRFLRNAGVDTSKRPRRNLLAFKKGRRGYTAAQKYWGGLLLADGCISANSKGSPILKLAMADLEHIEKFRRFLGSTSSVCTHAPSNPRVGTKKISARPSYSAVATGADIDKDVIPFGVTRDKSHCAKIPEEFKFDRDFWRGVIDGDGSIGLYKRDRGLPRAVITMCGTKDVCNSFIALVDFVTTGGKSLAMGEDKRCFDGFATVKVTGLRAAELATWLYDGADVYLERKMSTALAIMGRYDLGVTHSMQFSLAV
jgi:hypothetical protein